MNTQLRQKLINIAKEKITSEDVSHDFDHSMRVLINAEEIAKVEFADMDIIVPAALFHDVVCYPKNHPMSKYSAKESADLVENILSEIDEYPKDKIKEVMTAIKECSFSKGIKPKSLESKILQDADGLEATGAIAIMRTFSSGGQMSVPFYHPDDPFPTKRTPDGLKYAIDFFYTRLLKIKDRMHTKYAKRIAERRTLFLEDFLDEVKLELQGK